MRTFVKTFQAHLKVEKAPHDEEMIWKLLRRLQILTFDFTATGSVSEDLARERALRALHVNNASRVNAFWASLIEFAIGVAKSGGDRSRGALLESFNPSDFTLPESVGMPVRVQFSPNMRARHLPTSTIAWAKSYSRGANALMPFTRRLTPAAMSKYAAMLA